MKEYKREKSDLEKAVKTLQDQSKHYRENLLLVDAWWKQVCKHLNFGTEHYSDQTQVIDEVAVISGDAPSPGKEA